MDPGQKRQVRALPGTVISLADKTEVTCLRQVGAIIFPSRETWWKLGPCWKHLSLASFRASISAKLGSFQEVMGDC